MTETSPRAARFCPACGQPATAGGRYCTSCGEALGGSMRTPAADRSQRAGLAVLAGFLAVGLALWFVILSPRRAGRLPLAEKPPATAESSGGDLPTNHPPIAIPAEAKSFIADLEKKAEAAPKDLAAWKNLAQVEYRAGQIDKSYLAKAEKAYRHVLGVDPNDLDAIRGLGNVHFDREEYAEAVADYSKYLERKPDDSNVRTDLGTMYLYAGKDDEAIREYRKVVGSDPKFYQAHFNLGLAYAKKGDAAKAAESLETARALAPDEATRKQIQAMIDRGGAGGAAASEGTPAGGLHERVEQVVRSHPIAGPKVVSVDWPSANEARVVLESFPMEAMPEFVRAKFLERLKGALAEAKKSTDTAGSVRLELVDRASGKVMAVVTTD
jgi:tetratricopeptide (TPR) repeat protein